MIIFQVGWCLLATAVSCLSLQNWTPAKMYDFLVGTGRFLLFLSDSSKYTPGSVNGTSSTANGFIAAFALATRLSVNMHYTAILSAFGVSAFTMWDIGTNFLELVKARNFVSIDDSSNAQFTRESSVKILNERYIQVVDTIQSINSMWSRLCLWFILYSCGWMATGLDTILKTNNYALTVFGVAEMITFLAALVLSAECYRKVVFKNVILLIRI